MRFEFSFFILFFFSLPKKETKKSSPGLFGDVCSIRKVFYFILFFFALPKKETKKSSPGLFGDVCSIRKVFYFILFFSFLHCPKKKQKSLARGCSATCSFSKLK